jgi:hypothetical protein
LTTENTLQLKFICGLEKLSDTVADLKQPARTNQMFDEPVRVPTRDIRRECAAITDMSTLIDTMYGALGYKHAYKPAVNIMIENFRDNLLHTSRKPRPFIEKTFNSEKVAQGLYEEHLLEMVGGVLWGQSIGTLQTVFNTDNKTIQWTNAEIEQLAAGQSAFYANAKQVADAEIAEKQTQNALIKQRALNARTKQAEENARQQIKNAQNERDFEMNIDYGDEEKYREDDDKYDGGGKQKTRKPTAAAAWVSVGRKVTLANGTTRTLYKNASKPGQQLRIRKMVTRNGSKVATYVAPPKAAKKR